MACITEQEILTLDPATKVLELGCGQIKRWPNSLTLDVNPLSRADVIHDLNAFPYPFEDNTFDMVIAEHVIEHLDNIISVMEELHRIIKPRGLLKLEVPHFSSCNFYTDPTHKHAFTTRSFDYFDAEDVLFQFHYSPAIFRKRRIVLGQYESASRVRHSINRFFNRRPFYYEQFWAYIFPTEKINFDLEVVK